MEAELLMAKCIMVVGQGVPVRMSDDDAFQIVVRDGDGEYCPKSEMKDEQASAYRVEHNDKCLRRLVGTTITPVETLSRQLQYKRRARR
jgi:hypothetical protein